MFLGFRFIVASTSLGNTIFVHLKINLVLTKSEAKNGRMAVGF